jgi:hypothetical protein
VASDEILLWSGGTMTKAGLAVLLIIFLGTAVMAAFISYNLIATSSPPFRAYPSPFSKYVGQPLGEVQVNQTALSSLVVSQGKVNGTTNNGFILYIPFNWTLNLTVYNKESFNLTVIMGDASYTVPTNSSMLISIPHLSEGNYTLLISGEDLTYQANVSVIKDLLSPYVYIGE